MGLGFIGVSPKVMARSSEGHLKVTARSNQLKTGKNSLFFFTILSTSDVYDRQDPPKLQQGDISKRHKRLQGGKIRVGRVLPPSNHPFKSLIDPEIDKKKINCYDYLIAMTNDQ